MQSTKHSVWLILGVEEMIVERIKRVTLLSLDFPPSLQGGDAGMVCLLWVPEG